MPLKVWNGSSWTTASRIKVWNGSAWTELTFGKVWNGSAWTVFHTGLAAQVDTAVYIRDTFDPASLQFKTDGYVYASTGSTQLAQDYQWLTGAGVSGDYEVYATVTSGVTPTGSAVNTWLSLASNVQWDVAASGGQYRQSIMDVQIRMAASPNTVLAGPVSITLANDKS